MAQCGYGVGTAACPRKGWGILAATVVLLGGAGAARADHVEKRDFAVAVDGKPAGESHLTITRRDDGSEVVAADANVRVRLIISHVYTYEGTEVWKNGRLQSLTSNCNDNGKRFQVTAAAQDDGLRVLVNGKERTTKADVWTTSYWKLADKRFHNQPVTVLDVDRGEDLARQLQYVATENLTVAGQEQKCYHFRVQGGSSPVDLWYDVQHRLVREEFMETRYHVVIELTNVRR
jgi:hypothetical protein